MNYLIKWYEILYVIIKMVFSKFYKSDSILVLIKEETWKELREEKREINWLVKQRYWTYKSSTNLKVAYMCEIERINERSLLTQKIGSTQVQISPKNIYKSVKKLIGWSNDI